MITIPRYHSNSSMTTKQHHYNILIYNQIEYCYHDVSQYYSMKTVYCKLNSITPTSRHIYPSCRFAIISLTARNRFFQRIKLCKHRSVETILFGMFQRLYNTTFLPQPFICTKDVIRHQF